MRNFIQFLVKYHIFLFFVGLQVMCFWFIYKNNSFHEASFVNSSNRVVGTVFRWKSNVSQYIELQRVNDELSAENEKLRNRLKSTFVNVNDHFVMINDTLRERKYRYKSAEVVSSTVNKQLNYRIICRKIILVPVIITVEWQQLKKIQLSKIGCPKKHQLW